MYTQKDTRTFREVYLSLDADEKVQLFKSINKKCGTGVDGVRKWAYQGTKPVTPLVKRSVVLAVKQLLKVDTSFDTLFPPKSNNKEA